MPLRERIDSLRLKTGQPISEDWYDELSDVLIDMSIRGAVTYEGYVHRSLIPYKPKVIDLGSPAFQFDEAYIDKIYSTSIYSQYTVVYKGSFYDIDVDFLHVYDSLDVPNYSIGFIKLDPYLISSPLRKITVQANSSILMDRGVWYVDLPSGVTIEVLFGSNWIPVLDSQAGLVISDGVNVRITNSNSYDVTVQAVFIR